MENVDMCTDITTLKYSSNRSKLYVYNFGIYEAFYICDCGNFQQTDADHFIVIIIKLSINSCTTTLPACGHITSITD